MNNNSEKETQLMSHNATNDSFSDGELAVDRTDPEKVASIIARQAAQALTDDSIDVAQNQYPQIVGDASIRDLTTPTAQAHTSQLQLIDARGQDHPFEAMEGETEDKEGGTVWSCGALLCNAF
jgi:hypothetical protein